jgi:hypothetical protein
MTHLLYPTMAGIWLDLYELHDQIMGSTNPATPAEARLAAALHAFRCSEGPARARYFWAALELLEPYAVESLPPEAAPARQILADAEFVSIVIQSYVPAA